MSSKHKKPTSGAPGPANTANFILSDVKLLLQDISSPESAVVFATTGRANAASIQNTIYPPAVTWTWADAPTRLSQPVTADDIGKFGFETDINALFQLSAVLPTVVWQPFQTGTTATWTWINQAARQAQPVLQADIGKIGLQADINTLFQLTYATPAVWQPVPNPTNTSAPFELSTGAADADSFHDFYRLQFAFEDVWSELLDTNIQKTGQQLYAVWDALMDPTRDDTGTKDRQKTFPSIPAGDDIAGIAELTEFVADLKTVLGLGSGSLQGNLETQLSDSLTKTLEGCNMLFNQLYRVGSKEYKSTVDHVWSASWKTNTNITTPTDPDLANFPGIQRQDIFNNIITNMNTGANTGGDVTFNDLTDLLTALDAMLTEKYRFDVFAPDSINFGLLLNYRQHWQPQSYQVGNLVSTIPLAPQETRRYTTKQVVKKTRSVKEIDDSLRSGKDETSNTSRVDSEIVERAKNQTNFQQTASGSFGNNNIYKVSAGMAQGQDQSVESAQTKREFHEAVVKSAQEYKSEHRLEISTEESTENENTSFQEIKNPNDELTVTYLFYELQRRYLVSEELYKVTPVVFVANKVPAPQEVDPAWLLRHDWILKRTILDDSFLPALEYLSTSYTGEEVTLEVLLLSMEQQKQIVDNIAQQVAVADTALTAATAGLVKTENQEVQDMQTEQTISAVKSFFDPLNLSKTPSDGNADRARVDFAKDALERAQEKVDQLTSDLRTETTALQVAVDRYTAAATKHFGMLAEIDRLRIHVKDNVIYYMQAIWTYEPVDQRYFRLYNLEVPQFGNSADTATPSYATGLSQIDFSRITLRISLGGPEMLEETTRLHQIADLENLIGFKGNYMIFPLIDFNYLTWFQMQNYLNLDDTSGVTVQDPDPDANLTIDQLKAAMATILQKNPDSFSDVQPLFEEVMLRLLSNAEPELVVVPSDSLYIEALPGTHPILEDFKLIHRAIDIKKAQAEARHAELENLRLAARLAGDELGDPDIDKVVVVGTGQNVTVDAGQ